MILKKGSLIKLKEGSKIKLNTEYFGSIQIVLEVLPNIGNFDACIKTYSFAVKGCSPIEETFPLNFDEFEILKSRIDKNET